MKPSKNSRQAHQYMVLSVPCEHMIEKSREELRSFFGRTSEKTSEQVFAIATVFFSFKVFLFDFFLNAMIDDFDDFKEIQSNWEEVLRYHFSQKPLHEDIPEDIEEFIDTIFSHQDFYVDRSNELRKNIQEDSSSNDFFTFLDTTMHEALVFFYRDAFDSEYPMFGLFAWHYLIMSLADTVEFAIGIGKAYEDTK